MNTWPGGHRRPMYQSEHERWNATHYPGTEQMCGKCDSPTGRCEEDSMYVDDCDDPVCPECYSDYKQEAP